MKGTILLTLRLGNWDTNKLKELPKSTLQMVEQFSLVDYI